MKVERNINHHLSHGIQNDDNRTFLRCRRFLQIFYSKEFPNRVSYNRFVELEKSVLVALCAYLHMRRVTSRGIGFVDSTKLRVCNNKRIYSHKTFAEFAQMGKTSMGWFYGFKLHLIVDDRGELVNFFVTPGNVDDRKGLKNMAKFMKGKLFGDKGYISKSLKESLLKQGIEIFTKVRRETCPIMTNSKISLKLNILDILLVSWSIVALLLTLGNQKNLL